MERWLHKTRWAAGLVAAAGVGSAVSGGCEQEPGPSATPAAASIETVPTDVPAGPRSVAEFDLSAVLAETPAGSEQRLQVEQEILLIIRQTVGSVDMWEDNGGWDAAVEFHDGTVVVSADPQTQQHVRELLNDLGLLPTPADESIEKAGQ